MSNENNLRTFLSKKAYEISYALFRMATSVKRHSFGDHLENKGLALIAAISDEDFVGARMITRGIEQLLRFGADVDVLNAANVEVVVRELIGFDSAIAEFERSANAPSIDLDSIFSQMPISIKSGNEERETVSVNELMKDEIIFSGYASAGDGGSGGVSVNGNGNGNLVKSAMRQSAILERIRQNGNCRLKEIQDVLPETSERTIRYDIQNLLEQGLIERLGNGGPATYYRARG